MPTVLFPENLHRRLALGNGGDEVGFRRLPVGGKVPAPNRLGAANACIHHHAVKTAKLLPKAPEYLEHLLVVAHVQAAD